MRTWFWGLPLRMKLRLVVLATAVFSLVVASAGFFAYDFVVSRNAFRTEAVTIARMVAETSKAAVVFNDADQARATLGSLMTSPSIDAGGIYDGDGELLATYGAAESVPAQKPEFSSRSDQTAFELVVPIQLDGQEVGALFLRQSLAPLDRRLLHGLGIIGTMFLATATIAVFAAEYFGRLVSRPMLTLHEAVQRLTQTADYSIVVQPLGDDEVGALMRGFNDLVLQLRERDESLRQSAILLEGRVEQRTHELREATDRAVAAVQEAQAADRAKSEFLATMSHEIRTPLNAIIGLSSVLLDSPASAEQLDHLKTVHTSGETLLSLINDILDFSKIEAGHTELEHLPFEVEDLVVGSLEMIMGRAREKGLELVQCIEPDVPRCVIGDDMRVRQVLLNLLGNGVKFTPAGEVRLVVGRVPEDDPTRVRLRFVVSDSGIGIPPEGLERLFKPFSQVDGSTTRRFGGTGLGLVISQRLVRLMGGEMSVSSEQGRGSEFSFDVVVAMPGAAVGTVAARPTQTLPGRRVLVAQSHPLSRKHIAAIAVEAGMACEVFATTDELTAALASGTRADAVIVDAAEPPSRLVATGIPIVGVRSHLRSQDADASTALSAIVSRPVRRAALIQAVEDALNPGKTRAAPSSVRAPVAKLAAEFPMRLLIVEDNAVNQKVLALVLSRLGYRADVAGNGLEGLQAVQRTPYDFVFMDVSMPEMDGLEATREIRRWESAQTRRVHIVGLTANASPEDERKCLSAGMDAYLTKPVRPEAIARAIREFASARAA